MKTDGKSNKKPFQLKNLMYWLKYIGACSDGLAWVKTNKKATCFADIWKACPDYAWKAWILARFCRRPSSDGTRLLVGDLENDPKLLKKLCKWIDESVKTYSPSPKKKVLYYKLKNSTDGYYLEGAFVDSLGSLSTVWTNDGPPLRLKTRKMVKDWIKISSIPADPHRTDYEISSHDLVIVRVVKKS